MLMMSACTTMDKPEFVGGAPIAIANAGRDVKVRWVWTELGPNARRSHFRIRDDAYDLPLIADPHSPEYSSRETERAQRRQLMEWELEEDISHQVLEELKACTNGGRMVDVLVRIEDLQYYAFEESEGEDRIAAVIEFFETDGSGPVGRYPVRAAAARTFSVEATSGGEGWSIGINDREDRMAERLGREICKETFDSTARPSWWRNMTD
ncbi:hypothetical protein ACIQC9_13000 [Brevundimonas sp. NPDC092305]|uniref:hypothetical protein n=1 Tax=Brevundimonas sp. NPDC092305 TaxID=3363957 RepID=UPI00381E4419